MHFIPPTEIARIGDGKKIVSLEYIAEEQLIMVIAGRQRQVKLVPVRALGGDDVEWIKVGIGGRSHCFSSTVTLIIIFNI